MYAIGITQSHLPPPLIESFRELRFQDRNNRKRKYGAPGEKLRYPGRFAAAFYQAQQTREGNWIWQITLICETRDNRFNALQDAYILAERMGQCRVYNKGLGKLRIK